MSEIGEQLISLYDFMNGYLEGMTDGEIIEIDTPAYKVANDLNLPINRVETGTYQASLFEPEPTPLFQFDVYEFLDRPAPKFGGKHIEQDENEDGYRNPVAYDGNHVIVGCPRGMCIIERSDYEKGRRHCAGC